MTIREVLIYCINKLKKENIEEPILKAKILVANILKQNKEYLIINEQKTIKEEEFNKIKEKTEKIIKGMPIQYITNNQEFMGLNFFVNENVLIPQPDTEILVEETIKIAKETNANKILDLCTGSGAIAISIAKNVNIEEMVATDISNLALEVASLNCKKNKTENIKLLHSNLFENINQKFDIIVSNPPYIKTEVINTLSDEVKNEPYIALNGGLDGLDFYREIINEAYKYLEKDGYLCLEIGYDQKEQVIEIINLSKKYVNIYSKKDLCKNDRIIICQKE